MKKTVHPKIILSILLAVITTLITLNNFAQTPIGLSAPPGTGGRSGSGNTEVPKPVTLFRNLSTPASNPLSATQQFSSIVGNADMLDFSQINSLEAAPIEITNSSTTLPSLFIDSSLLEKERLLELINEAVTFEVEDNNFHLFSHGKPGKLLINGVWMGAPEIVTWVRNKSSWTDGTDICIYGCDFAQGAIGQAAVDYIEKSLNVNIAASTNITGARGDWVLEAGHCKTNILSLDKYDYSFQTIKYKQSFENDNSGIVGIYALANPDSYNPGGGGQGIGPPSYWDSPNPPDGSRYWFSTTSAYVCGGSCARQVFNTTVSGLQANKSYTIRLFYRHHGSAGNYAILAINANGIQLGTVTASANSWYQFSGNFTTTGTSINLTIDNLQSNQLGNDFMLDNIEIIDPCSPIGTPVASILSPTSCSSSTGSVLVSNLPSGSWTLTRYPGGIITNGSGTNTTIGNLLAGTYTFTVINSGNCISSASSGVTLNAFPTPTAPITGTVFHPTCPSLKGSVVLSGLPSSGTWSININPAVTLPTGVTGSGTKTTIGNLPAGSYTFTVTNSAKCTSTASSAVTLNVATTPTPPTTGAVIHPNCSILVGSVALSGLPSSGTWSISINPAVAGATGVTGTGSTTTIGNLPPGSYTFKVTNVSVCSSAPTSAVQVIKTCVVQPPLAQNIMNAPMNNSLKHTHIGGFVASDPQGDSITSYRVTTLPATNTGFLYICSTNKVPCTGSYILVTANQVLTPAQAASLYFDPINTFIGTSTFSYTATSKNGTSNVATETIPVINNPPTANSFTTKAFAQNSTNNLLPPLIGADADGTVIKYTVMPPLPAQGTITYCITPPTTGCGTLINITTVLTPAQISTLRFSPATGVIGIVPFTYTTTDNNGNVSTIATITIPVTPSGLPLGNLPPLTQNVTIAPLNSNHGSTLISPLIGTDPDGAIANYTINTIPSAATGVLYYCTTGKYPCTGTVTPVTANQSLTPAQAATLQFDPVAGNNTPASFTYSAKDNNGLLSNLSSYTVPVINTPPTAVTIQTVVTFNSINAYVPALQGNDADGTLVSFKVTTVPNAATEGTLFYCSNGTVPCTGTQTAITPNTVLTPAQAITVNFTPVTGYVGTAKGTYTTTDNNGNESQPAIIILKVEDFRPVGLPPVAKGISISLSANAPTTALVNTFITGTDPDGTIASYTITSLPPSSQGVYTYCTAPPSLGCGTPVTLGILTPIQASSLSFKPNATYTGPAMLGFTVTDNSGNMSNIANSTVNVNSIPPIAKGYTTAPVKKSGVSMLTPLLANDLLDNGTIVSYTITSIPTTGNGTLTYCLTPPLIGCGTAITVGTFLTPAQAATVRYTPGSNMTVYEVPFTFTATDNSGNLSNVATIVLPVDKGLPDFSSTIEINRVSFARVGISRDMVIKIAEQIDNPSLGQIVVMISKVLGFDITFSPTTTLSNVYRGLVVNNKDWLITENSTFIICTLKSGLIIPRFGISSIGMNITRKIKIAKNASQTVSVIIINDSGGDTDKSNNVYSMSISAQ